MRKCSVFGGPGPPGPGSDFPDFPEIQKIPKKTEKSEKNTFFRKILTTGGGTKFSVRSIPGGKGDQGQPLFSDFSGSTGR